MISKKHNIDEYHDISHSMDVLHFANDIYERQIYMYIYPQLKDYKNVIQISALLHDMCDKKYMDEKTGSQEIFSYLESRIERRENLLIDKIITTMSYSKVKKFGFPVFENMGHYWAYHVVRGADLLSAYDFDRCRVYHIQQNEGDLESAFDNANKLFENRVLKHYEDNLLLTDYSIIYIPIYSLFIINVNELAT